VRESIGRIVRKTPVDRGGERRRQSGRGAGHARRLLGRLLEQQRGDVRRFEGKATTQREISDHAERVNVAAPVDGFARGLLGAHEVRGPHDFPRIGDDGRVVTTMGDAEVGDERAAGGRLEQDVVGLHIAVHDAASVGVREGPRHLAQYARRFRRRQRTARAESLTERLAFHVAHDEEDESARFADTMDGDDVRVREARRHARLPEESLARGGRLGEVRGQDLDGDVAVELYIARQVDDAHATTTELALEGVLTGQGGLQVEELWGRLRHGMKNTTGRARRFEGGGRSARGSSLEAEPPSAAI
jgi:hypothetical protein